jgi:ornithine cyclodeaminase/alanine dehydrogenase-like protein (mu-crystallin family)
MLYLTEEDVQKCMEMPEAVALAKAGSDADGAGRTAGDKFYMAVEERGFVKPFSGYVEGEELAYVKTFTFFDANREQGLPVTDSLVLLLSAETGLPVCLMEGNWITAVRTAASTAVTALRLARDGTRVAAIFGAGGLGRQHCLALDHVFRLDEIRVVDIVPGVAEGLCSDLGSRTGCKLRPVAGAEEAVRGADVVVTVTTGSAVNVEAGWLGPGTFVARLGSYQEIALDVFDRADKLIVDRWEYVSSRIPEMLELIGEGRLGRDDVHAEWPDIVGGRAAGRESRDEVILYVALGIWGEYAAILPQVYRNAVEAGLGTPIPNG